MSQSIHQPESEIGNPIFKRTPGRVTLTAFGKEYLNHLYTLRNELSSLDDFCLRYAQPDRHVLRIAAVSCDWINSFFSKIIYQYQEHPLQFSLFHTDDIRRYPYVAYGSFQRNCNIEVMRTIGLSPFRSSVISG